MSKSVKENKPLKNSEIESKAYVKEIYDDLMETYQVLFKHMGKVDQLLKERDSRK